MVQHLTLTSDEILESSFKHAFTDEKYADVTLVSDEQSIFHAHKAVLSTCSPLMKEILISNPHPHPWIYLRGVQHQDLQTVLQFMYLGSSMHCKNRAETLLEIARKWQIKQLEEAIVKFQTLQDKPEFANNQKENFIKNSAKHHCKECNIFFAHRKSLYRHIKKKHTDNTISNRAPRQRLLFTCDICGKRFKKERSVEKHKRNKHVKKEYFCDFPVIERRNIIPNLNDDTTRDKGDELINELILPKDEERSSYDQKCNAAFSSRCTMLRHQKLKHGRLPLFIRGQKSNERESWNCSDCDKSFSYKRGMIRHKKDMHTDPTSTEKISCKDCEETFALLKDYYRHKRNMHQSNYFCDQCNYETRQRGTLKQHYQAQHLGIKHKCEHCEYKASQKSALKNHIKSVHLGTKYDCNICDFKAAWKHDLKKHIHDNHNFRIVKQ